MSLSIFQAVFILFIFLSFSKPDVVIAHTPHSWFIEQCNGRGVKSVMDPNLCLKILESQENIVSSRNKIELSAEIIKSGFTNGTHTRTYIKNMLKKRNLDPNLKGVLQKCKLAYDSAVGSFFSALREVKRSDYLTATYDLLVASTDAVDECVNATASKKIKDATIFIGNKLLKVYGFIGYNVAIDLRISQPPAPYD